MATARSRRTAIVVVSSFCLAACTLDFDRYEPGAGTGAGVDAGLDVSSDVHVSESAAGDSTTTMDSAGVDVVQESTPSACKPIAGTIAAPPAPGAITIDGDLSDWGSTPFTLLDASDAALIMGPSGTCTAANATTQCLVPSGETAELALLWDAGNLYVGVRVTVTGIGGFSTTAPYTNDAVEIYLRGDAVPNGDYTTVDHQYLIDWQNLTLDYGPPGSGTGQNNPPGLTSAVSVATGNASYVVEAKIALSTLGLTTLAPGQKLGFDLGVDHGQGTAATRSFLVWWMSTHGTPPCTSAKCTGCAPDQPYCDTLDFGLVCAD